MLPVFRAPRCLTQIICVWDSHLVSFRLRWHASVRVNGAVGVGKYTVLAWQRLHELPVYVGAALPLTSSNPLTGRTYWHGNGCLNYLCMLEPLCLLLRQIC